jgi:hypothetical protein
MNISRRMVSRETGRLHRENMLRSLLHRIEIAEATGNRVLVEQLSKEKQELGL